MSIVVFQHESFETAGVLGEVLQRHGHRLRTIELFDGDTVPADLDDVDGIIAMGGTANVDEADRHAWLQPEMSLIKQAHEARLPVVGVCLGAQLIAATMGGKVEAMEQAEVGWHPLTIGFAGTTDPVLAGITWTAPQFHLHSQQIIELPAGAVPLAGSKDCRIQAFKLGFTTYAFQFHFEWTMESISELARNGMLPQAGGASESIMMDAKDHYPTYRRLGDRLCENIATYLFPIDKRQGR